MIWTDILNALCFGGSLFIQVAQINRILQHKSVLGLSEVSWILQCVSSAAFVAYAFCSDIPLKQWGETVIVLAQYLFIVYLIWLYGGPKSYVTKTIRGVLVVILVVYAYLTFLKKFPRWLLIILGVIPLPSVLASKGPQILLNFRQKHTGELSPVSVTLQSIGNFARTIVASVSHKPDLLIIATHVFALSLAVILLSQILYYKSNTTAILKRKRDNDIPTSSGPSSNHHQSRTKESSNRNRKGLVKNRLKE